MKLDNNPRTNPVIIPKRPPFIMSLNDPKIPIVMIRLIKNPIGYKSAGWNIPKINENIIESEIDNMIEIKRK